MDNLHAKHRERLRKRFLKSGIDSFEDINLLELLLFYAIPRRDTNDTAHHLLNRFGTIDRVFEASIEELCQVEGIGKNSAILIRMVSQLANRADQVRIKNEFGNILDGPVSAGRYLMPRFSGERDEVVYMICMDSKCKILNTRLMFRGSVNSANVSIRKIVENALNNNATKVILAHNHVSGIALPSQADIDTTSVIKNALAAVEVTLVDHIVVVADDFVSMADSGLI